MYSKEYNGLQGINRMGKHQKDSKNMVKKTEVMSRKKKHERYLENKKTK